MTHQILDVTFFEKKKKKKAIPKLSLFLIKFFQEYFFLLALDSILTQTQSLALSSKHCRKSGTHPLPMGLWLQHTLFVVTTPANI